MKPNILLIAPIFQYCGWGLASKSYAKALKIVSNLTIRNIYLSHQRDTHIDVEFRELENTKYDHYDIVIQKTLPNLYYYDGRFSQNIGLCVFETEFTYHNWFNRINMIDKFFVPSLQEKKWITKKIKIPIFNISEPIEINIQENYKPLDPIISDPNIFKFLFIGENIPRKGLTELIRAYFSAFSVNDNVLLIIKTSQNIAEHINNIKKTMRRFINDTKYPDIFLIFDRLSDEQLDALHYFSDIFVMPSYGEAFNRPAAASLIFNKPVIATNNTGICDYLTDDFGWRIESYKDRVFSTNPPLLEIYKGNEYYNVPIVDNLILKMQESYNNLSLYRHKVENIQQANFKERFSYETIGKKMLEAINA